MNNPLTSLLEHVPATLQGGATGVSIFTILAAFLDRIHGPVVTIGAILGAIWLAMQMINMACSWVARFRKHKGK